MACELCVVDEFEGRRIAVGEQIPVMGTGGLLLVAKRNGLIPKVQPILDDLSNKTTFRLSTAVRLRVLKLAGEV